MTLDSDNVRFMRIFVEFPEDGESNVDFQSYIFGTLGNEANIII